MNEILQKIREFQPYVINTWALFGLAMIGWGLYGISTEVPAQITAFNTTLSNNAKLVESKNSLNDQEKKLRVISKELDKLTIQILTLDPSSAPELEGIKMSQKVIAVAEGSKDTYVSLVPGQQGTLDVDKSVSLPISIPGAMAPVAPAGGATAPAPSAAAPPGAPPGATPAAGPGAAPGAAAPAPVVPPPPPVTKNGTSLNTFQYQLVVEGTYLNLATFIHDLTKMPEFVIINDLKLSQKQNTENPDIVTLTLDFTVPWKLK